MSKLIPFLATVTGLSEHDIRAILLRAPASYKHYLIDKRTGGSRLISQPAHEVKALQRAVVSGLRRLPIHEAATAYRDGISIRDNAARHAANGPIMKFDFANFFYSIRADDWRLYCSINSVFTESDDIELSARLLFHKPPGSHTLRLAVGAPSSPWLSNVLMFEFDRRISEDVGRDQVTYTRYADDLTFSARRTGFLTGVNRALRDTLREIRFPALAINDDKTVVATTKYRRVVTGLVLANDGRVTIGRERKRLIRSSIHHALAGTRSREENTRLVGLLAFAGDIEPAFIDSLRVLYGANFLTQIAKSGSSEAGED